MTRRKKRPAGPQQAPFGSHIKRLREVRRLTQEELAERSGVAADTIRRLEHEDFSPSLNTLRKVSGGLGLTVGELFASFELALGDEIGDLLALVSGCDRRTIRLITALAHAVIVGRQNNEF
jgi:transcriptional regulator with XRE-family HTH domain